MERKSRRNALTSGVASSFPFASYELSDKNGVFLGLNLYNKSPVFLDFYDDYKYTNGNTWVGGSSGAGKTFTLQSVGGRLRQQGKQVIYIVPKKGHEFRPMCEEIGGQFIRLAPSSPDCINIMEIRRVSLDVHCALRNLTARDDSVLADKISRLIIFYSLLKKDLSDEDKNYLDTSLVECYAQSGISFVMAADMDLRRMDAVCDAAKALGYPKPAMAALDGQASALLYARYRDTGRARVFILTDAALMEALGGPPGPHSPDRTQFLSAKGDGLDAPLIQAHRALFPPR